MRSKRFVIHEARLTMRVAVGLVLCLLCRLSPVAMLPHRNEAWPGEPVDNHFT